MDFCADSSREKSQKAEGADADLCYFGVLGFVGGFPFAGLEREEGLVYSNGTGARRQLRLLEPWAAARDLQEEAAKCS